MDFYDFKDTYTLCKSDTNPSVREATKHPPERFYPRVAATQIMGNNGMAANTLQAEYRWYMDRRPYYRLWPSIIPALSKVDLSRVMCDSIHIPNGMASLAIYLPKGYEIPYQGNLSVKSILIARLGMTDPSVMEMAPADRLLHLVSHPEALRAGFIMMIDSHSDGVYDYIKFRQMPGVSIHDEVMDLIGQNIFPEQALRLAVSVMLLENDPRIISSDILSADRDRYRDAVASGDTELAARLEAKAQRRGKLGWDIGRSLHERAESCPHYRHPHFAIYWVKPDRAKASLTIVKDHSGEHPNSSLVPVLRLRDGAFVNRKKALELPTGYEDHPNEKSITKSS